MNGVGRGKLECARDALEQERGKQPAGAVQHLTHALRRQWFAELSRQLAERVLDGHVRMNGPVMQDREIRFIAQSQGFPRSRDQLVAPALPELFVARRGKSGGGGGVGVGGELRRVALLSPPGAGVAAERGAVFGM